MKPPFKFLLVGVAISLCVASTSDASIQVGFSRITNNATVDVADQLGLEIMDNEEANAAYGLALTDNQALFLFTNNVGIDSSISEIYIDDGVIVGQYAVHNSLGGYTDFTGGGANPGDLPGGNDIGFEAIHSFSADAQGNPELGVDSSADVLGIVYSVTTDDLDGIQSALHTGVLRVGLHVVSINGSEDASDGFVNDDPGAPGETPGGPIPEPGSLIVFSGLALCCAAVCFWRKKRS